MPAHKRPEGQPDDVPVDFHESLAPAMPLAPASDTSSGLRLGYLYAALWIILAVTAGVALGLYILRHETVAVTFSASPVATANVVVARPMTLPALSVTAVPAVQPSLKIATVSSVTQAQAGSPLKVASVSYLQAQSQNLQPGYGPYTRSLQGSVGTSPVVTGP